LRTTGEIVDSTQCGGCTSDAASESVSVVTRVTSTQWAKSLGLSSGRDIADDKYPRNIYLAHACFGIITGSSTAFFIVTTGVTPTSDIGRSRSDKAVFADVIHWIITSHTTDSSTQRTQEIGGSIEQAHVSRRTVAPSKTLSFVNGTKNIPFNTLVS
jgi:hypothetical protein